MEYRTTDLVLAATLLCFGSQLKNIELFERRGTFVLDAVKMEDVQDFFLSKLVVEPIKFNNTVRFLNTSIQRLVATRSH